VYFTHLKRDKRIGDDVGDVRYVFTEIEEKEKKLPRYVLSTLLCKNMTPNALKCILLP
jgi:hypothetical protein